MKTELQFLKASVFLNVLRFFFSDNKLHVYQTVTYRVIHKFLRDFRTLLRNNQDRHGRKEHINR